MLGKNLIKAAAGNVGGEVIEDLFQTWLYTGNSSTQTITNGIDLAGEGGLVWIKRRDSTASHAFYDTERGIGRSLSSDDTQAQSPLSPVGKDLTAFNADGFSLGGNNYEDLNFTGNYASWTFRKARGFFDIVTYTGNGTTQNIAHNLGSVPGVIIVKRTDSTSGWLVYHHSLSTIHNYLLLNSTATVGGASAVSPWPWGATAPTNSQFSVGFNSDVSAEFQTNANGASYVAYLFAHDAQIFGEGGDQSVIKCGSYTTDASGNATVDLGWEPQWILYRNPNTAANWQIEDTMRGAAVTTFGSLKLLANLGNTESSASRGMQPTPTGFKIEGGVGIANATHIYIAIRRGPMKTPTSGTEVFKVFNTSVIFNPQEFPTNFAADAVLTKASNQSSAVHFSDKLRGGKFLETNTTNTESGAQFYRFSSNTSVLSTIFNVGGGIVQWLNAFRRAPGFFDVVAYTGTGAARTVAHNLGVAPELMIVKDRGQARNWPVYSSALGNTKALFLNLANANSTEAYWNSTSPTASVFSLNSGPVNESAATYIAYLFATLPGVSKCFNYTGTGTTLQIDCGFTSGARLVLIKRTDFVGDWYIWDSARGIISGNDPYLLLNSTAAEVTNTDYIDPYSAGFEISSTAPAAINASGGSFIGLAIA